MRRIFLALVCAILACGGAYGQKGFLIGVGKGAQAADNATAEMRRVTQELLRRFQVPTPHVTPHIETPTPQVLEYSRTSITPAALSPTPVPARLNLRAQRDSVEQGRYDKRPALLLSLAQRAEAKGDTALARLAYNRAKSWYLHPYEVVDFWMNGKQLRDSCANLLNFIVVRDYAYSDVMRPIYLSVPDVMPANHFQLRAMAQEHNPGLIPLVDLTYRTADADSLVLCKAAVNAVLAGSSHFDPAIERSLYAMLLTELSRAEKYAEILDYFSREPLKEYAEDRPEVLMTLCDVAWLQGDDTQLVAWGDILDEKYPAEAAEYAEQLMQNIIITAVENPTEHEFIQYLLDNSEQPASLALLMLIELNNKYFPQAEGESEYAWIDKANFSLQQLDAYDAALFIASHALDVDNGLSPEVDMDVLKLFHYSNLAVDSARTADAAKALDQLAADMARKPGTEYDELRIILNNARAYIAAHGMDKPKAAYKILKANEVAVESADAAPDVKLEFWRYLLRASEALGKKADAETCRKAIADLSANLGAE